MDDVAATLGRQESATLEFKREASDRDAIRRAICALANDLVGAGGGTLLIGVANDGTPHPVDTSDDALLALTNLRDDGKTLDRPSTVVTAATYAGAPVIRVDVAASATPPVRVNGVVWVRPGPTTRRATRDDERVLSERRRSLDLPYDSRPRVGTTLDDLDVELLRSVYVPRAVAPDVLAENQRTVLAQLASLGLCSTEGVPTTGGLLVGGDTPSRLVPGAYLQLIRFDGDDVSDPVIGDEQLNGNLITMSRELNTLLALNTHTGLRTIDGWREELVPDYPITALRELVVNALMHRNYETSNAQTRIFWFSDRVQIDNPGGPYGNVRADNFDRANDYRNPFLAAAMTTLGYANHFGRGITAVARALTRNGNPPAEFTISDVRWSVTLRRAA